ncbi:hypothetical protein NQ317_006455 [Molorchus minor]|uniref:Uncharacterized protein n=1 Tax=Molorchus minor TaxID=1323400 RepID=A0ABQ9IW42_9CUCU|nr:hypothetical protein NQ317_006455 [Molorchus minor]
MTDYVLCYLGVYSELSTGSSSELALCSPSISQGIMPDLTQGTFEFMEESLNELPRIHVPVSSNSTKFELINHTMM